MTAKIVWPDRDNTNTSGDISNPVDIVAELFNTLKTSVNETIDKAEVQDKFRVGRVLTEGLEIDTATRTVSWPSGILQVYTGLSIENVNESGSTSYSLNPVTPDGLYYILYNTSTKQFNCVDYLNIPIDISNIINVGYIYDMAKTRVINGYGVIDGVRYGPLNTAFTQRADITSVVSTQADGLLDIDLGGNTFSHGVMYIVNKGSYIMINAVTDVAIEIEVDAYETSTIMYDPTSNKIRIVHARMMDRAIILQSIQIGNYYTDSEKQIVDCFYPGSVNFNGKTWHNNAVDSEVVLDPISSKVLIENLFDKGDSYIGGYYELSDGTTIFPDLTWNTTGFIPVTAGKTYCIGGDTGDADGYRYYYDENRVYIKHSFPITKKETIPEGVYYIKQVYSPADHDTFMVVENDYYPQTYGGFGLNVPLYTISPRYLEGTVVSQGGSSLGPIDYQAFDTDYSHIIYYGQSLSMGWQSAEAITTTNYPGTYMIGENVRVRWSYEIDNYFQPLISTVFPPVGESPAIAATNSFKRLFDRFSNRGGNVDFVTTNCGQGGRSLEQLSKICTNGENFYNTTFMAALSRAKTIADYEAKSISCSSIVYMQGENNYDGAGLGFTPGTDATADKDEYKRLLLILKNDMQADIMARYGQTDRPLFFVYQVAGTFILRKDMSINMALIECAYENEDVILLNPTYGTPDYDGGHLSTNGYRWYGELTAKTLYNTFIQGVNDDQVNAEKFTIHGNTLTIDCRVPVPPLVIDTLIVPPYADYGFSIYKDSVKLGITNIELVQGTQIRLTASASLQSAEIEVTYAGYEVGAGNIRDSDKWVSQYKYVDETSMVKPTYTPIDKDGNNYYGKKYPCYNWLNNFYYKL